MAFNQLQQQSTAKFPVLSQTSPDKNAEEFLAASPYHENKTKVDKKVIGQILTGSTQNHETLQE